MNILQPAFRNLVAFNTEFQKAMDVPDKVAKVALSIINLLKELGLFVLTFAKTTTTLVGVIMVDDIINPFTTSINILNGDVKLRTINLLAVQVLNAVKAAHYFQFTKDFTWLNAAVAPMPFVPIINSLVISLSILGIRDNYKRHSQFHAVIRKSQDKIISWTASSMDPNLVRRKVTKWENKIFNAPIEKQKALNAMIADAGKIVTASLALAVASGVALPGLLVASVGVAGTLALGYRTGYNVWAGSQLRDVRA